MVLFLPDGWAGGRREKFLRAVSQKPKLLGSSYLVGTLVERCSVATSWCDLDLTFGLTVVTLSFKILSRRYLTIRHRKLILGRDIG